MKAPSAPRAPTLRLRKPPSTRARRPEARSKRPEGTDVGKQNIKEVPRWWVIATGGGSYPEFLVWDWLKRRGFQPNVDFHFQSSFFGGRLDLGGLVADFIIDAYTPPLIIRVQGEYWHTLPGRKARDWYEMVRLVELGFDVVDAWEDDLLNRLNYTMEEALKGRNLRPTEAA